MKEPKKAWAVTCGAYSDYRVVAIFDSEGRAVTFLTGLGFALSCYVHRPLWLAYDEGTWRYVGDEGSMPEDLKNTGYDVRIESFDYYDGDVLPMVPVV